MLDYLLRGLPGHPLHPPLTDAVIGTYTFATIAAFLDVLGIVESGAASAWWIALVVGLVLTVPTALTGLVDWLKIEPERSSAPAKWGSPLWRTATAHMLAMVSASVVFLITAIVGYGAYEDGSLAAAELILTIAGFGLLTLGGWLGGTVVFVHGMRVLNLVEEPASRAAAPVAHPEKKAAQRG
jgi:uncharacterized membrane protein